MKSLVLSASLIAAAGAADSPRSAVGTVWVEHDGFEETRRVVMEGDPARVLYELLLTTVAAPAAISDDETVVASTTVKCGRRQLEGRDVEYRCLVWVDREGEVVGDTPMVTALIGVW